MNFSGNNSFKKIYKHSNVLEMGTLEKKLFLSCFGGDVEGVKHYLRLGANMNVICPSGRTCFGIAAQTGNLKVLRIFIDYCKNIDKIRSENRKNENGTVKKPRKKKSGLRESKSDPECLGGNNENFLRSSFSHNDIRMKKGSQKKDSSLKSNKTSSDKESNYPDDKNFDSAAQKHSCDLIKCFNCFARSRQSEKPPLISCDFNVTDDDDDDLPALIEDGMDKLEWDTEIETHMDLPSLDSDDSGCDSYPWDTTMVLDMSELLRDKPPPNDLNREDQFGCRAIHYAANEGHVEAVRMLINAGCKVNVGDSDNVTPLHMAAARDIPKIVELLISGGASVHHKTTERVSPLHVAASRGFLRNVKILLKAGAHIDSLDSSDRSPLFMAVSQCHYDVVAYLLRNGAKVNLEEIHGYTPLYEGVWQKNTSIVRLLLKGGAKITQSHYLLHYAVVHRHEEMVRLLLAAGSIINLRDEVGDTPLIVASKIQHTGITRMLLENGATVNYTNNITGNTPLHELIYSTSMGCQKFNEMFSILQKYDVNLEAESDAGYTALGFAINQRLDDVAATLIRHGADVNHVHIFKIDLFTPMLYRGNRFLCELFVFAGYQFQHLRLSSEPLNAVEGWLAYLKKNPMRLSELCRIKVRSMLKAKVYEKLSKLFLPATIKSFLKLEDITSDYNE